MMKRILKRPMFRMGGDVENVGIMDGMRNRYKTGAGVQIEGMKPGSTEIVMDYSKTGSMPTTADSRLQRRLDLINRLTPGPNLNQFLIDFGLNLASGPPRGNILSTAAAAARDPFQRFMAGQQTADKTRAALAIEALTDDDKIAIEKQAELMAQNPKSPYYNDKDGAMNALFTAKLAGSDEYRKTANPEERAMNRLTNVDGDFRMGEYDARKTVPYFNNLPKIIGEFDKKEVSVDTINPFRHAKRSKKNYKVGLAYINVRSGAVERFDPDNPQADSQGFIDISDLVDLSEIM